MIVASPLFDFGDAHIRIGLGGAISRSRFQRSKDTFAGIT
jgi:hypothetical protein